MFKRWCRRSRVRVSATKDQLDKEIEAYMKAPLVTGCPVIDKGIEKKHGRIKIPVSVEIGVTQLKNLVQEGWQTKGEVVVMNNKDYLYYFLNDGADMKVDIPMSPMYDAKAEYKWKKVNLQESHVLQDQGWLARSPCSQTNQIWLCKKR